MAYEYQDGGVRTIVEDETLADALRNELPDQSVVWRTLEDAWDEDGTVRRIIRAEVLAMG